MKRVLAVLVALLASFATLWAPTKFNLNQIQWGQGPALVYVDAIGKASLVTLDPSVQVVGGVISAVPMAPPVVVTFTPTPGQTVYQLTGQQPKAVWVFYNGVLQTAPGDYSISANNLTITMAYTQSTPQDIVSAMMWR